MTSSSTTRRTTATIELRPCAARPVDGGNKDARAVGRGPRRGRVGGHQGGARPGRGPGQTAGFYVKAIEIAPDLSKFRLYFTSIARANATYHGARRRGARRPSRRPWRASSRARRPATSRRSRRWIIDEETYVEQGFLWQAAHFAYLRYIMGTEPVPTVGGGTIAGSASSRTSCCWATRSPTSSSTSSSGSSSPDGHGRRPEPVLRRRHQRQRPRRPRRDP